MTQENLLTACKAALADIAKTCAPNIEIGDLKVLVKIVEGQNYALRMAHQVAEQGAKGEGIDAQACVGLRDACSDALEGKVE